MLKEFAWKAFEYTGNIDAYIFFKEMEARNKPLNERETAEEKIAVSK